MRTDASSKLLVLHLHTRGHHLQAPPISTKGHLQASLVRKPLGQVFPSVLILCRIATTVHVKWVASLHLGIPTQSSDVFGFNPSQSPSQSPTQCYCSKQIWNLLTGVVYPKSTVPLKWTKTHIVASVFIRFFDMSMKILMFHSISL